LVFLQSQSLSSGGGKRDASPFRTLWKSGEREGVSGNSPKGEGVPASFSIEEKGADYTFPFSSST
jgi:hypothetical protein